MTLEPLLDLMRCSNESMDFTLVGIYNALTVSSLAEGSTLAPVIYS